MKILDRALIIIFNLLLILTVIIVSAIKIASTPEWYMKTFEANGLYQTSADGDKFAVVGYFGGHYDSNAELTYEQTEIIANHISGYLSFDKDDFSLTLDSVVVNGKTVENAPVFGDKAVKHMADVKAAVKAFAIIGSIFVVAIVLLLLYYILRKNYIRKLLLRYSIITYLGIIVLIALFFIWCVVGVYRSGMSFTSATFFDVLWENLHLFFFPFQPDSVAGSFFNDTLTSVLSLDFFMDAVTSILRILISVILIWMIFCVFWHKKKERK